MKFKQIGFGIMAFTAMTVVATAGKVPTRPMEMVDVTSGAFVIGARDDGDDGKHRNAEDELPRHSVTLSAFWIGKYEVTNEQYCAVLNWANSRGLLENKEGGKYVGGNVFKNGTILITLIDRNDIENMGISQVAFSDGKFRWTSRLDIDGKPHSLERHPVCGVSWAGAVAFCNWLSEIEGLPTCYDLETWTAEDANPSKPGLQFHAGYRLPTEAEWERAAAWDGRKHWIFGTTTDTSPGHARCNYHDGKDYGDPIGFNHRPGVQIKTRRMGTSPVGWFNGVNVNPNGRIQTIDSPSPVGCYDMSGNLWEWCHDWYSTSTYTTTPRVEPTGPATGEKRVIRGGDAGHGGWSIRTANRFAGSPDETMRDDGFRVCRSVGSGETSASPTAAATAEGRADEEWPGERSSFHSFPQYKFKIEDMECIVVVPNEIAAGKPWIWRARFFGHEPQTDIALLKKGFHVAYVDVADLYGSPKAIARWDAFYRYLTGSHGFAKKAVLEGMSRGGLIIFNWAARNPEKVCCIYADAPVCDFKSWPGINDAIMTAYALTKEQAEKYDGNPVDNLKPLAEAGVPLLHVVGDADKVVPVAENTAIIEKRYKELGGSIQVIHKKDIGHHPHSLKDPTPIVEFILKHAH